MCTPLISVSIICAQRNGCGSSLRLRLDNITVVLDGKIILEDVRLDIRGPGLVLILGPNGAGKTTLFRTILGLIRPVNGSVIVEGVNVTGRPKLAGRYIGYVPQLHPQSSSYPITVYEALSKHVLTVVRQGFGYDVSEVVKQLLSQVDIPPRYWHRPLRELSGGLWQRFLIARALIGEKRVLLLDEPLSAVDPHGRKEIIDLIHRLSGSRLVIVSTHDPSYFAEHANLVILLNRRVYGLGKPSDILRDDILTRVYGGKVIFSCH